MCVTPTITRPLNTYSEITIKGTKYKIHSIFDGEKSFQNLMEDLIVMKASQQKTQPKKLKTSRIKIARGTKLRYNKSILKRSAVMLRIGRIKKDDANV